MTPRRRRAFLTLACVAAVLLGLLAVEYARGQFGLRSWRKEMRARGEKVMLAELVPPPVPPADNCVPPLMDACERLKQVRDLRREFWIPSPMRFEEPGRAQVAWRLETWTKGETTHSWADLVPLLEEAAPALAELRAALEKPGYDSGFDYDAEFQTDNVPLETIMALRQIEKWLVTAALSELQLERKDEALANAQALASLVRKLGSEKLVITQLVRQALAQHGFNLAWEMLQKPGWSDAQLELLQREWQGNDFVQDMLASFEIERAMGAPFCARLRSRHADRKETLTMYRRGLFGSMFGELTWTEHGLVLVQSALWKVAWSHQDERRVLQRWEPVIERMRLVQDSSWTAAEFEPKGESNWFSTLADLVSWDGSSKWHERFRFPLSSGAFGVGSENIRQTARREVFQQLTVTAIALHRYQLRAGEFPPDLQSLVPEYLDQVPMDLMSGQALKYRPNPDGTFLLYAAGENGKDDGGSATLQESHGYYSDIWHGLDAVWPAPTETPVDQL